MGLRQDIVIAARSWIGTPWHHQARTKEAGVDCAGLILGIGMELGLFSITADQIRRYAGYGRAPNPARMRQALGEFMLPVAEPDMGDAAWMAWRPTLPMHLGILAEHQGRRTLIHAARDFGKVVEHDLSADWLARIESYWRYPGVD